MNALNSLDNPNNVVPNDFSDFTFTGNNLAVNMPAKSIIVFELNGKISAKIGASLKVVNPKPQLKYTYCKGYFMNLPDFSSLMPVKEGYIEQFTIRGGNSGSDFAVKYAGYIKIPQDGFYNFYLKSDDGTKLFIDDKLIVNNDGRHAPVEINGFASLKAGFHKIEIQFFQTGGGLLLEANIGGPNLKRQPIHAGMLFHEER